MAKLYSCEVVICATAYVVADTKTEAREKFEAFCVPDVGKELLLEGEDVYGGAYKPDMPEVSLSPAMTLNGRWIDDDGSTAKFDIVEDFDEDDGTNGQDRDSYSDTQDRDSYTVDEG